MSEEDGSIFGLYEIKRAEEAFIPAKNKGKEKQEKLAALTGMREEGNRSTLLFIENMLE